MQPTLCRAPDPGTEVSGRYLAAFAEASSLARHALDRAGVARVAPEAWYPLTAVFDALRKLRAAGMTRAMRLAGTEIAARARDDVRRLGIADAETFLRRQADVFAVLHRGPAPGAVAVTIERLSATRQVAFIACFDPYPCVLWRGWLEGAGAALGVRFRIGHRTNACKRRGDDHCEYEVRW